MPNKPNKKVEELTQRDNPAFATDDSNQDEQSSPTSLEISSSEYGESSTPNSANTTGDISCIQTPNEPRIDERQSISYQVIDQFFREETALESSADVPECQSHSGLVGSTSRLRLPSNPPEDERLLLAVPPSDPNAPTTTVSKDLSKSQSHSGLVGSTSTLSLPSTPPADERRPPDTLAVPPTDLNIPTITVSKDLSVKFHPASEEASTKPKTKGGLGHAITKLVVRLSPGKEKLSPSDKSQSPGSSADGVSSTSISDKPKSKKASPLRFLRGKDKSPKDSPGKKKKSPSSKLHTLVDNALHPKKLFLPRCGMEGTEHLTDFEDPPKAKSEEKPKRTKDHWEDVVIPKDFKKVESTNFSETTIDSLSTQHTLTDSPMSDILNSNREVTDQDSDIQQPSESRPESDNDMEPEE